MNERERFNYWWNNKKENISEKESAWEAWQAARWWIPVEEELPEEDQIVWAYDTVNSIGPYFAVLTYQDEEWVWSRVYDPYYYNGWKANDVELDDIVPTHYRPLPELPEDWRGE
jgi:hypothetical protein